MAIARRHPTGAQSIRDAALVVLLVLLAITVRFTGGDAEVAVADAGAQRAADAGGLRAAIVPPVEAGGPETAAPTVPPQDCAGEKPTGCPRELAERAQRADRAGEQTRKAERPLAERARAFEASFNVDNVELRGRIGAAAAQGPRALSLTVVDEQGRSRALELDLDLEALDLGALGDLFRLIPRHDCRDEGDGPRPARTPLHASREGRGDAACVS